MLIGGYSIKDQGFGLTVSEYEAGWSFFLQGDEADRFRDEWKEWRQERGGEPFSHFLADYEYDQLFQ